jgi:hypothetical protein
MDYNAKRMTYKRACHLLVDKISRLLQGSDSSMNGIVMHEYCPLARDSNFTQEGTLAPNLMQLHDFTKYSKRRL